MALTVSRIPREVKELKAQLLFGLILLLAIMLSLSVQSSHAERMNCWVGIVPEKPTELPFLH